MSKPIKLIVEGPDGSGKSTLIDLMRPQYPEIEFADRAFISDRVYAYKFDRDTYLGVDICTYLSYWEQVHANNLDTRIILCLADADDLAKRAVQKDEEFCRNRTFEQVKQFLQKDMDEFEFWTRHIVERYKFPLMVLNTSKYDIEHCIQRIKEFIK